MRDRAYVSGIDCFAESATLRRVLRKALENFILNKYEDIGPAAKLILNDENVTRFFRSVISFGRNEPDRLDRALKHIPASTKITGFFLGLNQMTLNLIVFFHDDCHRPARYSARLEKLSRLREKKLH